VDDSAFARKVIREILTEDPRLEVVAIARDGIDALEKITTLDPDVVTLDLVMPALDGLGVLQALRPEQRRRVVVVSIADEHSDLGVAALTAGAFDLVQKPTALAVTRLHDLGTELVAKVVAAGEVRKKSLARAAIESRTAAILAPADDAGATPVAGTMSQETPLLVPATSERIVVIGTSTGGPPALTHLVKILPGGFPCPVAIVLHIPVGYTASLAERLNRDAAVEVVEASDDLVLRRGLVVVARAGNHLKLGGTPERCVARLTHEPLDTPHRPSVDVLFASAAKVWGSRVIGVVLTGMGNDGLAGARDIREAGGTVLTEAESSCVVYGMPRAVVDAGLSDQAVPLDDMIAEIVRRL
jgi:two-component system chemotaxis response regulator CheB